jgi:prepilin-type N-terminal cleavage/methylation domain-containing protein
MGCFFLHAVSIRRRRGVSLVELLVCLAIIGMMISMLMPAIHAVRMSSQRTVCVNHKAQINLSLQMYADANKALPAAPRPGFPSGWTWEILPFMEEGAMRTAIVADQPITAAANASAARTRPPLYRCAFASTWRSSDVAGVLPSDFLAVVSESKPGSRRRKDISFSIVHAPETNTLPWPVAAETSWEEYGRLRSQGAWNVWHPASSGTGLSGLIDGDGAD